MWRLEKDPYLSSTFANLSILDRAPDFDRLRRRMERATVAIPRLRQRVQSSPANITPPVWVDDPDFDIDYHVRRIALPAPGTMRQMLDLATLILVDPFDRTRPLWQFVVIEGLEDSRAVLVEKLHHTIADGEGSVQLSLQFFDFERDAPEPEPLVHDAEEAAASALLNGDLLRDLLAGSLKIPLSLVKQVRDLIADPASIPSHGASTVEMVRNVVGQLSDVDPAKSPLWTTRSLRRRVEVLQRRSSRSATPLVVSTARSTPRCSPSRATPPAAITADSDRPSTNCGRRWPSARARSIRPTARRPTRSRWRACSSRPAR